MYDKNQIEDSLEFVRQIKDFYEAEDFLTGFDPMEEHGDAELFANLAENLEQKNRPLESVAQNAQSVGAGFASSEQEKRRQLEEQRIAEERWAAEEQRIAEERRAAEEERRLLEEERKRLQQEIRQRELQAQQRAQEEERRRQAEMEAERRRIEQERQAALEEKQKQEELRKQMEAERKRLAAEQKLVAERRAAEEKLAAERKAAEEERRRVEAERQAALEEQRKIEEERRRLAMEQKLVAERRAAEEKLAAERKAAEDKLAAERKAAEEKLAAERQAAEAERRRMEEERQRLAEERLQREIEEQKRLIAEQRRREEEEKRRREAEEKKRRQELVLAEQRRRQELEEEERRKAAKEQEERIAAEKKQQEAKLAEQGKAEQKEAVIAAAPAEQNEAVIAAAPVVNMAQPNVSAEKNTADIEVSRLQKRAEELQRQAEMATLEARMRQLQLEAQAAQGVYPKPQINIPNAGKTDANGEVPFAQISIPGMAADSKGADGHSGKMSKEEIDNIFLQELEKFQKDDENTSGRIKGERPLQKYINNFDGKTFSSLIPAEKIMDAGYKVKDVIDDQIWNIKHFIQKKIDNSGDVEAQQKTKKFLSNLLVVAICVFFAYLIAMMITHFVAHPTRVEGESMESTLTNGDTVVIEKMSYYLGHPKRYDVVVFPVPNYNSKTYYIKRVIALPGETVQIKEGKVYIDDKELDSDKYGKDDYINDPGIVAEPVTLAKNEYFVLGDNRNTSTDSRTTYVGMVKERYIIGKAWERIWPLSKLGSI